jgi:ketosteroid isomerase-like protein
MSQRTMSQLAPGSTFYEKQIAALESGDVDRVMGQYHDDAVLVSFDTTVRGLAALREHFVGYLARLGSLKLLSTDHFAETPDSIFLEATVRTSSAEAKVYDVFILRDGKATHHFTGLISVSPLVSPK